jgi:hypothetical protein
MAVGIAGCVTEIVPVQSRSPGAGSMSAPGGGGPVSNPPPLNATPTPPNATSTTRVAAAIKPLGAIPYDGFTLPLVSPDGRWIATQTGPVPGWESVLAEPGAVPMPGSAIAAFEVVNGALQPVVWPASAESVLTAGLLLGRCAGDGWVLVERPNENGSRWIGKLQLGTGNVEWLVQGDAVNAQALLLRDGTLIYTRRTVDQAVSTLVFQSPAGVHAAGAAASAAPTPAAPAGERVIKREGWKFCQPVLTPDQAVVAVVAIGPVGAELLAYSTTKLDAAGVPLLVGRDTLGPVSAAAAFQASMPVEASPPEIDSPLRSSILLVNADRRRLVVWDPVRNTTNMLPPAVLAAVRVQSPAASGIAMASRRGVDFWTGSGVPARLVAGDYVPRSFSGPAGTRLLLLTPQTDSSAPVLRVLAVEMVVPNP